MQACATRLQTHPPARAEKVFFPLDRSFVQLKTPFYLALPEASPFLLLSLECFHVLTLLLSRSPLLSVLIVIALCGGKSLNTAINAQSN